MELKDGYKQTELGIIPEDWEVKKLGEVAFIQRGASPRPINNPIWFNEKSTIGWVRISDVTKSTKLLFKTSQNLSEQGINNSRFVGSDNLIMSICATIGRPIITAINVCIHDGFVVFRDLKLNKEFLYYYLTFIEDNWSKDGQTGSQINLNTELINQTKIKYPLRRTEQQAIAEILSDTDELIQTLKKLIAKKKAVKQGAMQELLTGKKRLQGFNGKWETKKLGEVAFIKTGSKNNKDKVDDGDYPFFVRSQSVERINTYSYDCEAILIPGEGGIGSIFHYINGKFDVHQRVYVINDFSKNVSGKYIYLFMKKNFGNHAIKNSVKATVDSLRLPTFQEFKIELPKDIKEQQAIAEILSDMDAEIAALEQQVKKTQILKQGIMQELLTGRIRLVKPATPE